MHLSCIFMAYGFLVKDRCKPPGPSHIQKPLVGEECNIVFKSLWRRCLSKNNVPHSQWVRRKKRSKRKDNLRRKLLSRCWSKGKGPNIMSQSLYLGSGTLGVGTLPSEEPIAATAPAAAASRRRRRRSTSISTKGCH